MDDDSLQQLIRELLTTQSLGVLATSAAGHPYTTLVGFVASEDFRQILFATHRATRKFANLSQDARVSMLIDNRHNRPEDFREAAALTAYGTACEVPQTQVATLKPLFLARHPQLNEFLLSPGCALCRISVDRYSLVRRFQDVVEWTLDEPADTP